MGSRGAQARIVGPGYLHVVLHIAYSDNPAASRTTRLEQGGSTNGGACLLRQSGVSR
jgi:hypothetical protein